MARLLIRLGILFAVASLIWTLFYTLEPRKTAYSCRTFWSCIGLGDRHTYAHSIPDASIFTDSQIILRDDTLRYQRQTKDANPELLFLVLNKDAGSWSSDFRSSQRSAHDFMDLLISTRLDLTMVSLAIMTTSADEYESIKGASERLPFARTTVYLRKDVDQAIAYEDRHNPQVQLARRAGLATLRNYLMRALQDEQHIVWLDADVVELSNDIVQTMVSHSESNGDAGIITALCHQNQMANYDKNAWKLGDIPHLLGPISHTDGESAAAELVATRKMLPELINGTDDSDLVPLDSVGGTILYIRADLVRQGVSFPHFNIVGTTWSQRGWVGVETEGICYMANGLPGGGCFVLGGKHHVRHSDWG